MSDDEEEPETPEEAKARLLASRIPVYVPGMRSFLSGIYPFYPDARLEPYSTMLATCSYEARESYSLRLGPRCGKAAVVGAQEANGTAWHRCWEHRELDYFGKPAVAVAIAWAPLPAWQRTA